MSVSVLRNPSRMDDEGWARVASGMKLLADLDVWVVDASRLSVEEIRLSPNATSRSTRICH